MSDQKRNGFIGGSDIAAIVGQSRWSTPLGVWAEKTGKIINRLNIETPEYVELGIELEDFVAEKFAKKANKQIRRDSRDFIHPEFPFLKAHIDRRIVGGEEILECKTCSAWKEKEWLGDEIPEEYILQVIWYLGIVGLATRKAVSKGYIAVLIGGQKFRYKEIDFDQDLFDKLVTAAVHFWRGFVETNTQPIAIGGDSGTLFELFPTSDIDQAVTFEGDEEIEVNTLLDSRSAGITARKEVQEEIDDIDAKLKQKLGSAEKGRTGQYTYTWKTQHRKGFEVQPSSSRVLRCKPNTKGN